MVVQPTNRFLECGLLNCIHPMNNESPEDFEMYNCSNIFFSYMPDGHKWYKEGSITHFKNIK